MPAHLRLPAALLAAALALLATPAHAQADGDPEGLPLARAGRIAFEGGWRKTPNALLRSRWAARPEGGGTPVDSTGPGGPLAVATFAYGLTADWELGVDLFGSLEFIELPGAPRIQSFAYGALLAPRVRLRPTSSLIFTMGLAVGPALVLGQAEGRPAEEVFSTARGVTAGVLVPLRGGPWALVAQYRGMLLRGRVSGFPSFSAGGHWGTVGVSYTFPPEPERSGFR